MNDDLGTRMKTQYEFRARQFLPRRTYTLIRIDGRSFHSYTRGLEKPFDMVLVRDLCHTAEYLCQEISGVQLAYVQSDEISLLLTDFATNQTQAWFDGNVQKIVSISAAAATMKFNLLRENDTQSKSAMFDSRCFTIPDPVEVRNYFVWRQKDAVRNSISMLAQSKFSHKQLHGKSSSDMQDMLMLEHGVNWNDVDPVCKRGAMVTKKPFCDVITYIDKRTNQKMVAVDVARTKWEAEAAMEFTKEFPVEL